MDFLAEPKCHSELCAAVLKDLKKLLAGYAAETVSAGCDPFSVDEDVDVVPVREVAGNRAKGGPVCRLEILEGLIGEYDSPPERIVALVSLEDGYVVGWISLLEQESCIQPGW